MTDKELLQQLKELKSICLSAEDKQSSRSVLFSQIANTSTPKEKINLPLFNFKNIFSLISQPLLVIGGVILFLVGSLILGSNFYQNSKPNDSLYIARVLSERVRLNTAWDECQRDALVLKFANQQARDIATVLADPEFNKVGNEAKVEKLSNSFRNEISKVKTKIEKTNLSNKKEEANDDDLVFSANSEKDDNGLDFFLGENKEPASSSESEKDLEALSSSTEEDLINPDELEQEISELDSSEKIISEIEDLFSQGDYEAVIEKLSEIEKKIK